jgi:hypothetical protein
MTTTPEERALLVEALTSAHRPRDGRGKLGAHPAFFDLDEDGRAEAFDLQVLTRALEAAADPEGLSTTGHAVLARIRAGRR